MKSNAEPCASTDLKGAAEVRYVLPGRPILRKVTVKVFSGQMYIDTCLTGKSKKV